MGQRAAGILYGCECPEFPDDKDGEGAYDLVSRWEKAKKIDWLGDTPHIRVENEGGKTLLGVWVAVGGSGQDGAPYFLEEAVPLDQVWTFFHKQIVQAEKLWTRFAMHVEKKEKIILPEPKLWLTPCETA